jgi:1-deoxy-D-xylulose-5-phosphate synthase
VDVPLRDFGIPPRFLDHGTRAEVLAEVGLTAPGIARQVTGLVARITGADSDEQADPRLTVD